MKNNNVLINEEKYKKGLEFIKNKNFLSAEKIFLEILNKFPNHLNSLFLIGFALYKQKKNINSLKYLTKATSLKENFRDADYFIGKIYKSTKQLNKAKEYFNKILKEYPDDLDALINLVTTKIDLKELNDAKSLLKKNKKLFINQETFENLNGYLYLHSGQNNLSIHHYLSAYKINPINLNTLINLAHVYLRNLDFLNSKKYFKLALDLSPKNSDVIYGYSFFQFYSGDVENGLINYEYRKIVNNYNPTLFKNYKEWEGQNLDNKTILILSEQGIGDIIQFSRYIFFIKKKYKVKIIFQLKKKLFHFFKNRDLDLREGKGKLPIFDYFIFLLSLPKIIYLQEKILVNNLNYIKINNDNLKKWETKLRVFKGKKIGISWQGDQYNIRDSMRSVELKIFEPLFKNKKLNFINLQSGFGKEQIHYFKFKDKLIDFSDEIKEEENAFEDTISILKNLDLIITVDSALAHLAGTLKVNTWLLQHYSPEWRWQLQNKKFSWYPKHKFFKQKRIDNWDNVIHEISKKLD